MNKTLNGVWLGDIIYVINMQPFLHLGTRQDVAHQCELGDGFQPPFSTELQAAFINLSELALELKTYLPCSLSMF